MSRQTQLIPVVVGVLRRAGKVLVAERPKDKPYSGYWEFPGGKVEPNETVEDALKREIKEELGVDVLSASPWITHQHDYPDKSVFLNLWCVDVFDGEPVGKESQQLRWVDCDEMFSLRLLEGNLVIRDALKQLF